LQQPNSFGGPMAVEPKSKEGWQLPKENVSQ